jgi:CubicO group peptidase (beta-lactamase class C family)
MSEERPIHGRVATGFEPVREAFEKNFRQGHELGASFAVERDGERLVDLWGGFADAARQRAWQRDTLVTVYSTTKGMAALTAALLVDRGALDYEAPVAHYWPEFGGHGRDAVTVAMLLSHQAGLSATREPVREPDFYEPQRILALLLEQEPLFEPGSASGYHAVTFGPLVGELVRRAGGESLGRLLRREVCEPLDADFFIGLPESEEPRVAELVTPARKRGQGAFEFPSAVAKLALTNPRARPETPNTRAWRAAEVPSVNGQGCAAGLARVYGALAAGGSVDGVKILSPQTLERGTRSRISGRDLVIATHMDWACGWMRNHHGVIYGPNRNAFGHSGFGGSFGFADRAARVGVGYVMNRMAPNMLGDPRSLRLVRALYRCLDG